MNVAPMATWALATWPPADEAITPPTPRLRVTYLVATVTPRDADPRAAVVGGRANRVDPTRTDVRPH